MNVLFSPHFHQYLLSLFLITAILLGVKWYLIVVWICISLTANGVEHLSLFIGHLCIFFEKMIIQLFCPFFFFSVGLFVVLLLSCKSSSYILDSSVLLDKWPANISSCSVGCLNWYTFFSLHIQEVIAFRNLLLVFFQPLFPGVYACTWVCVCVCVLNLDIKQLLKTGTQNRRQTICLPVWFWASDSYSEWN